MCRDVVPDSKTCGSEPARESGGSVCINTECTPAFAGKPAPTWNRRCVAMLCRTQKPVGASLLAKAVGQLASMLNALPPSQASPRPHGIGGVSRCCTGHKNLWDRARSRKRGSVCINTECTPAFAGKPAPTWDRRCVAMLCRTQKPVGASLLAKAVGQLASMLNALPPSRASPRPHGIGGVSRCCTGHKNLWDRARSRKRGSVCINTECTPAFAGKPAPTWDRRCVAMLCRTQKPVGASLLAIAVDQSQMIFSVASTGQSPPPATGSSRG
ncbi:hypothetical protein SAMN03159481_03392 [Pseudomonas sp. NFACC56-3]|nr:hypothetical protein SAMN03159481_03392 [Pseudomonas sp. NFACC56-3]